MNADRFLKHYARTAEAPDAVARMRRFTLDLAVRGKLVSQESTDTPASELLKRIDAKRAQLVVAGRIPKERPVPGIDAEEGPYEPPRGWSWTRIRRVTSGRGQVIPRGAFTYVDVTAINNDAGRIENPSVVSAADAPSRARKVVLRGDVLYACVRPYLLNIAIVEDDFTPAPIASTAFAVLNGFGLVLPRYLWIVLRSPFFVECVEEKMRGQAYPAINDSDFALLAFPLAPLAEQHRIVAKVDELMVLCDRLEAARAGREATRDRLAAASLARLNTPDPDVENFQTHARFALNIIPALTTRPDQIKQLRQTILNLAVRGKLVRRGRARRASSGGTSGPYELPPGWEWLPAQAVCAEIVDCPHSTAKFQSAGIVCIDTNSFKGGRLVPSKLRFVSEETYAIRTSRLAPAPGDIVFAREGSVGEAVTVPSGLRCCLGQRVMLFRPGSRVTSDYLQLAISEPSFVRRLTSMHKGIGAKHVNVKDMRVAVLPIPPVEEQREVVAKLNELMTLCDKLEAALTTGEDARGFLLGALLHEGLTLVSVKAA